MKTILKAIDSISEWTGRIAIWALVIVTGIVVYEVITRRIFHSPHVWTYEIITFFYGFHFMILASYTLFHRGHVSIDILYNRLPRRKQVILDVITYLFFFFPFIVVLLTVGYTNALSSWITRETTLTARLPYIMPSMKTITPVTAILLLIQGFSIFYKRIFFLVKGYDLFEVSH